MSKRTVARARLHAQERRNEGYPHTFAGALSAAVRGYKQPGRKLGLRDSYDFFEAGQLYGPDPTPDGGAGNAHWGTMQRALDRLNTRDRKAVYRILWADSCCSDPEAHYPTGRLSRAQLRALRAAQFAEAVERAIDADERLLANAY